ncbi:hypothetical protein GCM10009740_05260 [Terrabacter terrae]|uniref:Uncharacterized protein n=1 Tax=Terrabacter terrae TaxID=318434 RepID=A0ABN2TUR7_9MICO
MDLDEVDAYLCTLDGVRARRTGGRRGWYVDGLLVARADAPGTVLVRLGGADRERLVTTHPRRSGCRPVGRRTPRCRPISTATPRPCGAPCASRGSGSAPRAADRGRRHTVLRQFSGQAPRTRSR